MKIEKSLSREEIALSILTSLLDRGSDTSYGKIYDRTRIENLCAASFEIADLFLQAKLVAFK